MKFLLYGLFYPMYIYIVSLIICRSAKDISDTFGRWCAKVIFNFEAGYYGRGGGGVNRFSIR